MPYLAIIPVSAIIAIVILHAVAYTADFWRFLGRYRW
jgi:hypothetical protein